MIVTFIVILSNVSDKAATHPGVSQEAKDVFSDAESKMKTTWNYTVLLLFVIVLIIMIYVTKKSNMDMLQKIGFAFLILAIGVIMIIPSEIYTKSKQNHADYLTESTEMPIFDFIMTYLMQIGIVFFGVVIYFLFTSKTGDGGGGT